MPQTPVVPRVAALVAIVPPRQPIEQFGADRQFAEGARVAVGELIARRTVFGDDPNLRQERAPLPPRWNMRSDPSTLSRKALEQDASVCQDAAVPPLDGRTRQPATLRWCEIELSASMSCWRTTPVSVSSCSSDDGRNSRRRIPPATGPPR